MPMTKDAPDNPIRNVDLNRMSEADYRAAWDGISKIEIRLVEKIGQCKHNVGDTYYYDTPYKKPTEVCAALLHVLDLYTWRVVLGFPSWNDRDRTVYRIHCPDHTGTIWEMRKVKS
jgi:uncharacterized repeat protein (TIGR04076 family)